MAARPLHPVIPPVSYFPFFFPRPLTTRSPSGLFKLSRAFCLFPRAFSDTAAREALHHPPWPLTVALLLSFLRSLVLFPQRGKLLKSYLGFQSRSLPLSPLGTFRSPPNSKNLSLPTTVQAFLPKPQISPPSFSPGSAFLRRDPALRNPLHASLPLEHG